MTRSVWRGMSSNARTISASRTARSALDRDCRPHALLELAAELGHEAFLVAGHLHVALGDQLLAVSRTHPQELHVAIMSRAARPANGRARQMRAPAPRWSGRIRRPAPHRSRSTAGRRGRRPQAIRRAALAASSGLKPSAKWAASADEWVQPEPCAAPSGCRSPGIAYSSRPSKNRSVATSRWPPVTTTAAGPSAYSARASASASSSPSPRQHARLRQVRRDHGGHRQQLVDDRLARGVVEQHGAGPRPPSRGRSHRPALRRRYSSACARGRRPVSGGAEHADLDRVDADVVGHGADLGGHDLSPAGSRGSPRRRRCSAP